ncbi:hypothetical protein COCMIDRAFT_96407 [Bipolaris oryzae ATCC 44560]|uniref:Uncharacterized protein n=1 Tax=Bipolaris oryzae ATCC 44560 TaxID=930090 RepID=W6ZNK4_COCMI|nr:uncharacterized protein COCMIDRAFT_96407 [Bipolaris oryzae ATCC 44560]EUC45151.1 hypothetical protein COCMIDRAFT_96407 [Bipolaris oryzae ATCC 44560]
MDDTQRVAFRPWTGTCHAPRYPSSATVWAPDDTDRGVTTAHIYVDASTLDSPDHVRLCKCPCSGSTWVHAVSISHPHYLVPAIPHHFPFCQSSLSP